MLRFFSMIIGMIENPELVENEMFDELYEHIESRFNYYDTDISFYEGALWGAIGVLKQYFRKLDELKRMKHVKIF